MNDMSYAEVLANKKQHPRLKAFANVKDAKAAAEWFLNVFYKYGGTSPDTAGGFLTPEPILTAIAELRDKAGVARSLMQVVPISSDTTRMAKRASGTTAYFIDENTAITESQASFDQLTLSAKKIASLVRASSELAEDAIAFAEFIAAELAFNIEALVDTAAFNGNGTSTYKGIFGLRNVLITGGLAGAVTAASGHDTWAEYDIADMASVVGALPSEFHGNAKWLMHPIAWALTCVRLSGTAGGALTQSVDGGRAFLGYPVVLSPSMQGGTAATDLSGLLSFAFGDFSKAGLFGDRRNGTQIMRSQGRYIEYDQIGFRATARFDVIWHGLGDTTTAGAIVGLVGQ